MVKIRPAYKNFFKIFPAGALTTWWPWTAGCTPLGEMTAAPASTP